jgi:ribosomal-protein-alanine N-acetyltransferase
MPRRTDVEEIRALLRRDPVWGVYALGDLEPSMAGKTKWFGPDLTLVLHDFNTNILFAMGAASVREALGHVTWPVHLQLQDDALTEVARHAAVTITRSMWRMGWNGRVPRLTRSAATRLGAADVPALRRLYADGDTTGEAPDFFFPSMVTDGVFFGIYDDAALLAAAGTHLLSSREGVSTIGNVYTRRDQRGRGLGRTVVSAVLQALTGIETVGLNVRVDNDAALHLYESLGFVRHCQFVEGLATGDVTRHPAAAGSGVGHGA